MVFVFLCTMQTKGGVFRYNSIHTKKDKVYPTLSNIYEYNLLHSIRLKFSKVFLFYKETLISYMDAILPRNTKTPVCLIFTKYLGGVSYAMIFASRYKRYINKLTKRKRRLP